MFDIVRGRMLSLSFIQRIFDWGGENGFGWTGRCRDWRTIAPQVSMSKKTWFQDKHQGTLANWVWHRLLS